MNANRRNFLKKSALSTTSLLSIPLVSSAMNLGSTEPSDVSQINIVGPKKGYTPHIGTMVSMLNWMRETMLRPVQGMSIKDLDYLHDDNSNTIGAMLWHLAATERFYQLNTFDFVRWGDWPEEDDELFSVAMGLGNAARKQIKGNPLEFYTDLLSETREYTLEEFSVRDDEWLMYVDEDWGWGPTNNYCKWFHVCEHESNHNGQFKYLKKRLHSRK